MPAAEGGAVGQVLVRSPGAGRAVLRVGTGKRSFRVLLRQIGTGPFLVTAVRGGV